MQCQDADLTIIVMPIYLVESAFGLLSITF